MAKILGRNSRKSKKEINSKLNIVSVARLIAGLTQGLNVVARVNPDPNFLNGIIKTGLSALEKSE